MPSWFKNISKKNFILFSCFVIFISQILFMLSIELFDSRSENGRYIYTTKAENGKILSFIYSLIIQSIFFIISFIIVFISYWIFLSVFFPSQIDL